MPIVTVNAVVFGVSPAHEDLAVLVVKRRREPFGGWYALPGGELGAEESLDGVMRRELEKQTGVKPRFLEQLYTFAGPERDPRGQAVTVAYLALVSATEHENFPKAECDAELAVFVEIPGMMELAFDHSQILLTALRRIRAQAHYAPIGFDLLPKEFP